MSQNLLELYFHRRLGMGVPADLDDYAERVGFADRRAFLRALAAEVEFLSRREGVA